MFESARIKLTLWYLAMIMTVSVFFSLVIYFNITSEFHRFENVQVRVQEEVVEGELIPPNGPIRIGRPDPAVIKAAKTRIFLTLGFINLAILGFSGAAGYFLAGRTLAPIKKGVDEQNRFITDASHELRTPITSLRTEIEVALKSKKMTNDHAKKLLNSNLEEVLSLQKLSDNLLELAQNGKMINPQNMSEVSIREILKTATEKIKPLASKKHITVINKSKESKIQGISDRLVEVFVILLDNAIKYSPARSQVEITSSKTKNKIEISVANYGEGIDEIDLPYIFDRFYRSDKSRSENGYGLGLSIAKKIIEAHGGEIHAESSPQKTTFKVIFSI